MMESEFKLILITLLTILFISILFIASNNDNTSNITYDGNYNEPYSFQQSYWIENDDGELELIKTDENVSIAYASGP